MCPLGASNPRVPFFTDGGTCSAGFGGAGGAEAFTGTGFGGGGATFGGGELLLFDDFRAGAAAFESGGTGSCGLGFIALNSSFSFASSCCRFAVF
jgi:hypothetical protein